MSERLLNWFGKRRGERILELAEKHLDLTCEVARHLEQAIKYSTGGKYNNAKKTVEHLSRAEIDADAIRRQVIDEMARGELEPADRVDLFLLIDKLDYIADWCRDAGRILILLPLGDLPEEIKKKTFEMGNHLNQCIKLLRDVINILGQDVTRVIKAADKVERLEELIDDDNQDFRRELLKLSETQGAGVLIMLRDFMDALENAADAAEDTADVCRSIAVRRH